MDNAIKLIVEAANLLDNEGMFDLADKLDKIADASLNIKTAQYVGIQGYAVRNGRCWSKCYRHKRAESPSKAAQEIWVECHKEFVQSLNNDGSKWDKYAEGEQSLTKLGSNTQAAVDALYWKIATAINKKIESGIDRGSAIFAGVEEVYNEPQEKMLALSNQLLTIAEGLVSKPKIAESLTKAAEELVKEAGLFDFMRGAWQGAKNWAGDVNFMGTLKRQIDEMHNHVTELQQERSRYNQVVSTINQAINGIMKSISSVAQNPQSTPKQQQYAQAAMQSLSSLQRTTSAGQLISQWPSVYQSLQSILKGNIGGAPAPAPGGPAPGGPAAPAPAAPAPKATKTVLGPNPNLPQNPNLPKAQPLGKGKGGKGRVGNP